MSYSSAAEDPLISSHPDHPASQICDLCRSFYPRGWVTGTGGGMSIRDGNKVYIAPSGVEKEKMVPLNLFVMDLDTREYIRNSDSFKPSACTPLFLASFTKRNAVACIHTHSQAAVLISLLYKKEFTISNLEQIKALPRLVTPGNLDNTETLVIPIIENTHHEDQLLPEMERILDEYPASTAVIVRGHGLYVWGPSVTKTKIYNESIDYIFELVVKMHQLGLPLEIS